jgi:sRNA-binding regulator protein Hfq
MMEAQETHKEDKAKARYVTPYGYGVLDNFGAQLIGRLLTFELMNNKMVTGKLKGYGQFDIMVTYSRTGQDYIIMKHAIVSVQGDFSIKSSSTIERR